MYCNQCGNKVNKEDNYCIYYGNKIQSPFISEEEINKVIDNIILKK